VKHNSFRLAADLIKIYLSLAVSLSAVTGYFLSGKRPDIQLLYLAAGVFFLASGAAVLNQFTERHTDSLMERTKNRPLASGAILPSTGLAISAVLFPTGSVLLLLTGIGPLLLGLLTVFLYNFAYTRLKPKSAFAVVPGALVGALPPLIGYLASGRVSLNHDIIVFSVFMFLWQLPHFWLILVRYSADYLSAGFPTLYTYMSEKQLIILSFSWIVLTSAFLLASGIDVLNGWLKYIPAGLNIVFILIFYRILFISRRTSVAFMLINIFTLVLMIILIIVALQS
jgi:heme o synthase